jgi:hypothetical protein
MATTNLAGNQWHKEHDDDHEIDGGQVGID